MTASILTTVSLLFTSLATAIVVTGTGAFWEDGAGAMLAVGHLLLTAVAIVGALVGAARWSVPVGVGLAGASVAVAMTHPITPAWVVLVVTAAGSIAGLLGTGLRAVVRQRPPADAPPPRASALALGMLATPLLIAVVQPSGVDAIDWATVVAALGVAVIYTRAGVRAVWTSRIGLPLLTVASALTVPWPGALLPVAGFATLTALAWSADARLAAVPLAAPGKTVPIPAELAPGEILDAAGLDERGRRKDQP